MNHAPSIPSWLTSVGLTLLLASIGCAASLPEGDAYTNMLGMKLVRIQPGQFVMGADTGGDFDEAPAHRVSITRPYFLAVTEVTNAQYEQFDPEHAKLRGKALLSKDDDEPAVFVSHDDAMRFCRWLSEKDGRPYRLPTEAEWEYACRAGTTTAYHTGDALPEPYHKHQKMEWLPVAVDLHVARTPANAWGLHDMHGNVEEWCLDWYGPYVAGEASDPVGYASGLFRVARGGSHSTPLQYLRSANRAGALPGDRHGMIGFRVVLAEPPAGKPLDPPPPAKWAMNVNQTRDEWKPTVDMAKPHFVGPRPFVHIPAGSNGPLFSKHNHQPAITACANGDLLAVWYSTNTEPGRELAVVATRLRRGADVWEPADVFFDAPDRNDHGNAVWWDGKDTIHHFNGVSTDGTWGKLALIHRTSNDNGVTWSAARIIQPEHGHRNQVIAGAFATREGHIIVACDAVPGGNGGTAIHISTDGGATFTDPGARRVISIFPNGGTGPWIAGIHAGVAQRTDGSLIAFGRGDAIDGQMPRSISADMGKTWTYAPSGLPPIGSGQRLILLRLREGPLLFCSFAKELKLTDAAGNERTITGLFAALSEDDGMTWPVKRLVTDDGPPRRVEGGGNTGAFTLGPDSAEPRGYLAATQSPDGMIHLISSKQHYAFNLAWIRAPMPATAK